MKLLFLSILGFLLISLTASEKPNVIIIFTDDHGYSDLSCQGAVSDVKTPHIDSMAESGVRCTSGYATAPQCCPSRAGLISGQYQQKFGLRGNGDGALPWSLNTLPERMKAAGYVTGMAGKWHLAGNGLNASNGEYCPGREEDAKAAEAIPTKRKDKIVKDKKVMKAMPGHDRYDNGNPGQVYHHGFEEYLSGPTVRYVASHDKHGKALKDAPAKHIDKEFRIDVQTEWSVNFIKRNVEKKKPFFLYLAYFAPHVPLDATEKYKSRFPGEMPERRRTALAMISAMDDGVGRIRETLKEKGQLENTLIFFISDNGAPLKIHKKDLPGSGKGWDGSLNEPMNGEKGMLTEGGIRVPFIVSWPGTIPGKQVYDRPVISLDASYTAVKVAGGTDFSNMDGVDLLPFFKNEKTGDPHECLYFHWGPQAAVRKGDWKLLTLNGTEHKFLYNMKSDKEEKNNVLEKHPEVAKELEKELLKWADTLEPKGLTTKPTAASTKYFEHYLKAKLK